MSQPRGRHLFIVEFAASTPDARALQVFVRSIDQGLGRGNDDYRAHRSALDPPEVLALSPGAFAAWMKQRGRLGGQNKVPRVIADPALFDPLRNFMADRSI